MKICEGRSLLIPTLHLLYQELKLHQLMRAERQRLAELVQLIAVKQAKKEYVDYYLREGCVPEESISSGH